MTTLDTERILIARRRLIKLLGVHTIAPARIIEQKISDAGPFNQRVDPHLLTTARQRLENEGTIAFTMRHNTRWYNLTSSPPKLIETRLAELQPIHDRTLDHNFTLRVGQTLEIAIFKALRQQNQLEFFGAFLDLHLHDDNQPYQKEEPPSTVSGKFIRGGKHGKKLDFLLHHHPLALPVWKPRIFASGCTQTGTK